MLTLFFISLFLILVLSALLFKFAISDGDFTLLSRRHVKREEIEDKVVWITGASRGIGEILAKQLASLGAKLILSARNETELERVRKQLTGKYAPEQVKILPLDLTSGEATLKEAVDKAESFFPGVGVDYMIHNAAYERPKTTALDVTEESLKATFNVNVFGTICLTRLLAPFMMRRGRGHFVVMLHAMSSAAGKTPAPGQAVYSASKYALNGYFHSLRSEVCRESFLMRKGIISLPCFSLLNVEEWEEWEGGNLKEIAIEKPGNAQKSNISGGSTVMICSLCQKGIKVTVVCPGPIETSNGSGASTSGTKVSSEKRVSAERCVELTIIAASHGLKEVWISYQISNPRIRREVNHQLDSQTVNFGVQAHVPLEDSVFPFVGFVGFRHIMVPFASFADLELSFLAGFCATIIINFDSCKAFMTKNEILHQSSCVGMPSQNGVVERKNKHLLETARALLFRTEVTILGCLDLKKYLVPIDVAFSEQISFFSEEMPSNLPKLGEEDDWKEIHALDENGTWNLVGLLVGKQAVGCKWVCTVKVNPDGLVARLKARLVAKRYAQAYGVDYSDTFSSVAKLTFGEHGKPVLAVMYLVQYMPTIGYWLMDKVGGRRVEAAAQKGNTYSLGLLFGKKKAA
ncbi:dehydrogenase/reductase SDR family member 7 isoform X1 [Gossypium australe]|uniref:Dehydrogenase/reductase SDR family member 7 isoform X1 n=1 Tax=Gossypium australe TaxID=47621 RepID=A0A5B6X1T7_9ROSI|nr:dehydrogenase/reductase SDR family member 7 isoform X1 [Gossypium australe]